MIRNLLYGIKEAVSPPPIPEWIQVAKREIGVREVDGAGSNGRIIEYDACTTLKSTDDSVPWCSAFMNWVMKRCQMERSHSAAARSWLGYGERLSGYRQYAIVVLRRGNSSWQGHVGFAMDRRAGRIQVLAGNQGDAVSYAWFPETQVLGFLWPKPEQNA